MNCLKQLKSGLLSSKEDLDALAQKKTAKFLVVSDTHGMFPVLKRVILKYGESSDALVFAGDGVGDLAAFVNLCAKDALCLRCLPPVVAFVRGNNDSSVFSVQCNLNVDNNSYDDSFGLHLNAPRSVVFAVAGKTVFVTHGHEYGAYYSTTGVEQAALDHSASIAIFGHTHFPFEELHHVYLMNPGSLSYPRNHSKPGFAFLNVTEKENYAVFFKGKSSGLNDFEPYNPEFLYW